jgi:hypothetical protein
VHERALRVAVGEDLDVIAGLGAAATAVVVDDRVVCVVGLDAQELDGRDVEGDMSRRERCAHNDGEGGEKDEGAHVG